MAVRGQVPEETPLHIDPLTTAALAREHLGRYLREIERAPADPMLRHFLAIGALSELLVRTKLPAKTEQRLRDIVAYAQRDGAKPGTIELADDGALEDRRAMTSQLAAHGDGDLALLHERVARARRSVVAIRAGALVTTGWVALGNGVVVASRRGLGYPTEVALTFEDGRGMAGRVIAADVGRDVALVAPGRSARRRGARRARGGRAAARRARRGAELPPGAEPAPRGRAGLPRGAQGRRAAPGVRARRGGAPRRAGARSRGAG